MKCKFSKNRKGGEQTVRLNDYEILKSKNFQYLGIIIDKDGEIEENVSHRIRARWMKWRRASCVLCDH